ncbi:MAG: TIGR02270 family protein [Methylococcaceae bacterium]|nr:TIGR02270 family protein [Methylococcaceae bacterium]
MAIIPTIISQHAEEASFLWLLRTAAVKAPHYSLKDIIKLDGRVEAHIDGLRIAGEAGWEICKNNLAFEEPGELFVAANLVLECNDRRRMADVLELVESVPETLPGFISAFGWVKPENLRGKVKDLLSAESPVCRQIGLAACVINRVDPGKHLDKAIESEQIRLKARALRAAGELKRRDLLPAVREHLSDPAPDCRFWAAWSAALLAKSKPLELLQKFVESRSQYQFQALQMVLRCLNLGDAQSWLKELARDPDNMRSLVIGAGITGNVAYIPWLIKQMGVPEQARIAGESFTMITGLDIAYEDLDGEWPEGYRPGPTENPEDQDVAMDPDEDLPMPDGALIAKWWDNHRQEFDPDQRYLCGKPISVYSCREILASGTQRQRIAAALELALLGSDEILFETRAPGFRQQTLLST